MPVVKTWDVRDARRKMGLSQSQMAAQLGVSVESYRTCDSRQQMEKQDGQIAHGPIVTSWRIPGNTKEIGIRHAQDQAAEQKNASAVSQDFQKSNLAATWKRRGSMTR